MEPKRQHMANCVQQCFVTSFEDRLSCTRSCMFPSGDLSIWDMTAHFGGCRRSVAPHSAGIHCVSLSVARIWPLGDSARFCSLLLQSHIGWLSRAWTFVCGRSGGNTVPQPPIRWKYGPTASDPVEIRSHSLRSGGNTIPQPPIRWKYGPTAADFGNFVKTSRNTQAKLPAASREGFICF